MAARMLFDLNEPPQNAEEESGGVVAQEASAVAPQEDALVTSQHQEPLPVPTGYPSNLFQPREGLQLQGILNNNAFKHASSGSRFQPFVWNKDSNEPMMVEDSVVDWGPARPESIKDMECKEAEEAILVVTIQETALVMPQPQKPLLIPPTHPSNLFQPGEGSQLQGMLSNNAFKHASEVERMEEESRKKDEEISALRHSFGVMEKNYANAIKRIGVSEERLSTANESVKKKEEEFAALGCNFCVIEQNYADANKRIGVLEEQRGTAYELLKKKEEELTAFGCILGVVEQKYADANKRIGVLEEQLSTANESQKKKEEELAAVRCNFCMVKQNYSDANKRIGVLEEQLNTANESLRKTEEELTALRHNFLEIEQNYAHATKRIRDESLRKKGRASRPTTQFWSDGTKLFGCQQEERRSRQIIFNFNV